MSRRASSEPSYCAGWLSMLKMELTRRQTWSGKCWLCRCLRLELLML